MAGPAPRPGGSGSQLAGEVAELRRTLAERRHEVHVASVLAGTIRALALGIASGVRRGLQRRLVAAARWVASLLAPAGTRRREALRPVAGRVVPAAGSRTSLAPSPRRYRQYFAHTRPSPSSLRARVAALDYLEVHPVVSVVVDAAGGDLSATLASLGAQCYDRIEVLVGAPAARAVDPAARVVVAPGAAEDRVNAAVDAATGEFVCVLAAGDVAAPHCLVDLVTAVQDGSDAAYGDEDRVDEDHEHLDGHLKPAAFGPETLLSYDVVGAPLLVRRELFVALGGLDASTAPVAGHDFALRLAEATSRIAHVGEVLLSRPASHAPDPADATAATIPVVTAAFERRGAAAVVTAGDVLPSVRYTVAPPSPAPSVAIVIPTRDRLDLLRACVESVESRSTYRDFSITICDNDSKEARTLEWMAASGHAVVACPGPFNYAKIVNRGVEHTSADFVVTLNNDTTIATPDWLERLVGLCSLDGVASVGVKLAYPDGRLQHEGVGIIPMPVHLSRDVNYKVPDRWLCSTRDAAAVTGACQIVRTAAWKELGGLDETFGVGYNDVDFGMRLLAAGWRVVYTPEVLLGHRESASRGTLHPPEDVVALLSRWDLFGDYVDPSMPAAARFVSAAVDPYARADAPPVSERAPRRADVECRGADDEVLEAERERLVARLGALASPPRTARTARWIGHEARAVLDDQGADELASIAPRGSRRRAALAGIAAVALRARRGGTSLAPSPRRYRQYFAHTRPSPSSLRARVAALDYLEVHPVVSVVVDAAGGDLSATLASLGAQCYDRIEVLVGAPAARAVDPAARVVVAPGAAEDRVNAAVDAATGEFVCVLAAGDVAAPHCLVDLVTAVQDGSDAAYGDEDRVDEDHEHLDGHLKPAAFGPETLLSYDVVGAPLLVRRELFVALGGLDASTAPVAGHDFALRLAEATSRIAHVGEVLLSRPASHAPDPADATAATIPVVTAAFERRGAAAVVTAGDVLPSVRYTVAPPSPAPSVAIVIPTRDRLDLLRACVESVESRSTYRDFSITICDNDSKEARTLEWMAASGHAVVACPGPFNYAKIVNRGVEHTSADFVVTLNNDTTIATPDWLERLVGLCSLDGVASVGVKLAYPDGRLQHEGVGIIPMPVHLSRDVNYKVPDRWLCSTRDAAAVTGACQIVRTAAWKELGGLDERLAVAFNDVDFGMRLLAAGWRVVYTPEVLLGHRESASRGDLHPQADEDLLIARWDLFGDYVDPSMPAAARFDRDEVVIVARRDEGSAAAA